VHIQNPGLDLPQIAGEAAETVGVDAGKIRMGDDLADGVGILGAKPAAVSMPFTRLRSSS